MPKFDNKLFRELINDHGYIVLVEKSSICSCYDQEHSSAKPDCHLCNGFGLVWHPFGTIKAAVTNIKEVKSQLVDATQVSLGDKMVSTMPEHKLALNDRLRFTHTLEIYQEALNPQKDGFYVPYYEIAKLESVYDENNEEISKDRVIYDIVNARLLIKDYSGRIAIRYQYYPYFLISELLHSNRQQWTLDAGEGSVEQLPQNFLAKRITTKMITSFAKELPSQGILLDLRNVEHQIIPIDYALFNQAQSFTIEIFQKFTNTGEFAKIFDNAENELQVWAFIRSFNDVEQYKLALEPGHIVVLTRDKYEKDYIFGQIEDGSIMTYLGGDIADLNNWDIQSPQDMQVAVSRFDPITNPDCEIPIAKRIRKQYSESSRVWRDAKPELILSAEDTNQVKFSLSGIEAELSTKIVTDEYYYVSIHIKNCTKLADIYTVVNQTQQSLTGNNFFKGIFTERSLEINAAENLMPLFRIYDRFLDTYEELSDYHYLMSHIEEPTPEEPTPEEPTPEEPTPEEPTQNEQTQEQENDNIS